MEIGNRLMLKNFFIEPKAIISKIHQALFEIGFDGTNNFYNGLRDAYKERYRKCIFLHQCHQFQ